MKDYDHYLQLPFDFGFREIAFSCCRSMSDEFHGRNTLFRAFVCLSACLVISGWFLSCFRLLRCTALVAALIIVAIAWLVWRSSRPSERLLRGILTPTSYWPFLAMSSLMLLAALLYKPIMLDSLTYRLPRILLWLQAGRIEHVITAEPRLNYMPQVWELMVLPLVELGGDRLLWVWGFTSWVVLYLLAYDWAFESCGDVSRSRLLAFLGSASLFAVLQGRSTATDLIAAVFVLMSLRFVMAFERSRRWAEINWVVISLSLAAGVKPHFAVLGLPLVIWFFAARSKPWRSFRWIYAPVLLPLWLLCSPLPCFVLNFSTYGSWAGPGQDFTMTGRSPLWNLLLGGIMIAWQSIQPPLNPFLLSCDPSLVRLTSDWGTQQIVPRFHLDLPPITTVDFAGLGLVASVLFTSGIYLALRRRRVCLTSWQVLAFLTGICGIALALSRFVSGGSARAYTGFLYLTLPLAIAGWVLIRPKVLTILFYLCFASAVITLVITPSRPLWPSILVEKALGDSPRFSRWKTYLARYNSFAGRARTGEDLAKAIPAAVSSVVVIVGPDRPLWPLLDSVSPDCKVVMLAPHSPPAKLRQQPSDFVILGGGADGSYPELFNYLSKSDDYTVVLKRDYTSKLARGAETWTLYRKVVAVSAAGNSRQ